MEIHYKCTTWCKLKFPGEITDEDKQKILERLNDGYYPLEIGFNIGDKYPENKVEWEAMNDTEEFMTVEENDGQSTIELMEEDEKGKLNCIWDNSYESELKRKSSEL